jgi:hypothetical protein
MRKDPASTHGALKSDIRSIYLNCEDFKQHTFPNVLIEILKVLFREIDANLSGWFGKKARTKAIVKQILARLKSMHQAPDTLTEQVKESASQETSKKKLGELSGEMSGAKAKIGAEGSTHSNINTERTFERHQQKLQELDLWLPELKANLREFFSKLLVQPLNCIRSPRAAPLAWRQAGEGEQTVAGFLQAVGDGAVLEPPLADECLAAGFRTLTFSN